MNTNQRLYLYQAFLFEYEIQKKAFSYYYRLEQRYKNRSLRHIGPLAVILIGCFICIIIRMILFGVNDYDALMTNPRFPNKFVNFYLSIFASENIARKNLSIN